MSIRPRAALLAFMFASLVAGKMPAAAEDRLEPIALVPLRDAFDAVSDARNVLVVTARLQPGSTMVKRLKEAANGGAIVSVGIDAPTDIDAGDNAAKAMRKDTDDVAAELALQGARIRWIAPANVAVVIADDALYVSNHDWPAAIPDDRYVIRDNIRLHRVFVQAALSDSRSTGHDDTLWIAKPEALQAEAGVIAARTSAEVDVMSSEIDSNSPVYQAIQQRAHDNDRPRLLISRVAYRASKDEQAAVAELQREGAEVRLGEPGTNAAIEGYDVWYGSEPATLLPSDRRRPQPIDVAFALRSPDLAARLHGDFTTAWNAATRIARPLQKSSKQKTTQRNP